MAYKKSAVTIQSAVRGWTARKRYLKIRKGVVKAQALYRGNRQRRKYHQFKVSTIFNDHL